MPNFNGINSFSEKFLNIGRNNTISSNLISGKSSLVTTTFSTLWEEGGLYVFPAIASQMTVSSDSTDDDVDGTGGRSLLISYLDEDLLSKQEIITLNGTTPVTTIDSMFRINGMMLFTGGSNNANVGNIYIGTGAVTAGKPTNVYNLIAPNQSLASTAIYTTPLDRVVSILGHTFSLESNKTVTFRPTSRNLFGSISNTVYNSFELVLDRGSFSFNLFNTELPRGFDLEWQVKVSIGTAEANVTTQSIIYDANAD